MTHFKCKEFQKSILDLNEVELLDKVRLTPINQFNGIPNSESAVIALSVINESKNVGRLVHMAFAYQWPEMYSFNPETNKTTRKV